MKVIFKMCRKGTVIVNEDVCGHAGEYAWVIDGATDVFDVHAMGIEHEVAWYVRRLSGCIRKACQQGGSTADVLRRAGKSVFEGKPVWSLKNYPEYQLPTYAICLVRHSREQLDYLILGDCCLGVPSGGRLQLLTDTRITAFSMRNRDLLKAYIEQNGIMPEDKVLFQSTRLKANAPDGYPIGSVFGSGISMALTGCVPVPEEHRFLMFSDGLLDYVRYDPESLARFMNQGQIREEITKMYAFLKDNTRFKSSPRPKKVDDCTMMLLEV